MKKVSFIFLILVNILNLSASIYSQIVLLFNKDFLSVISLKFLTTSELLYFNVIVFSLICMLICLCVLSLCINDKPFKKLNIFASVPKAFIVFEILIFGVAFYNSLSLTSFELLVCTGIQLLHILSTCICGGSMVALKKNI